MPAALPRRAAFLLGLATAAAGPLAVAVNLVAAGVAFGAAYPLRWATWGRREDQVNDTRFPRRAIPAAPSPSPLPPGDAPPALAPALAAAGLAGPALAATATTALLVLHDGRLVHEAYANGAGAATLLGSRSMAKSVLAMLAGIAIAEGRIPSLDTPMHALVPQAASLRDSPVTLRDMLRMAGGLRYRGDGAPLGAFTAESLWDGAAVAYFVAALRAYLATARPGDAPGARFRYDDRGAQLVGLALERAFATPVSQALSQHIWTPMGAAHPAEWALNSRHDGLEKLEGGLYAAATDWLRLGRLVLDGGGGILDPAWVAAMTAPLAPVPPNYHDAFPEFAMVPGLGYGLLWWTLPGGDCFMHGLYGQVVYVCPAARTVIVRTGRDYGGVPHWPSLIRRICDVL